MGNPWCSVPWGQWEKERGADLHRNRSPDRQGFPRQNEVLQGIHQPNGRNRETPGLHAKCK